MELDVVGFGSLNLDEFWEVDADFLNYYGLEPGREYVKDLPWFEEAYPALHERGALKKLDPGGSAANMIAALRRMGFRTGFFGATGVRDAEKLRLGELGSPEHVKVALIDIPAGRCLALINRDDPGRDRCLVILPNANDHAGSIAADYDIFNKTSRIHMTSFVSDEPLRGQCALMSRISPETRVSFDPGAVYVAKGAKALLPILKRSTVLFATEEELEALAPERDFHAAARYFVQSDVETVVAKQGARGMRAYERSGASYQPAIPPERIVDRTGAGDVAAAGFIAGKLKNLTTEKCLHLAALAASKSIEGYGRSTYPDASILERFC